MRITMTWRYTGEVLLTQIGQRKPIQEPSVHPPDMFRFLLKFNLGGLEKAEHNNLRPDPPWKQALEASMSLIRIALADSAVQVYDLLYGYVERLLDPCFMCAFIPCFRISLHLPHNC